MSTVVGFVYFSYYKTKISLESLASEDVAAAEESLKAALPEG